MRDEFEGGGNVGETEPTVGGERGVNVSVGGGVCVIVAVAVAGGAWVNVASGVLIVPEG